MNDCIWGYLEDFCNLNCKCDKYLSANSIEGKQTFQKIEKEIDEALKPIIEKIAKENGFRE